MPEFENTQPGGPSAKYIEPKISLMWLLGAAGTLLSLLAFASWNLASANAEMRRIGESVARMERQIESRDSTLDRMQVEISSNRSLNDVQNSRINNLEEQQRALRAFAGMVK